MKVMYIWISNMCEGILVIIDSQGSNISYLKLRLKDKLPCHLLLLKGTFFSSPGFHWQYLFDGPDFMCTCVCGSGEGVPTAHLKHALSFVFYLPSISNLKFWFPGICKCLQVDHDLSWSFVSLVFSSTFGVNALEFSLHSFELSYAFKRTSIVFYLEFLDVLLQERFSRILSDIIKETEVSEFQFDFKNLYW